MTVKVEDVNKAAAVIIEFCNQHKDCFECPACERGSLYGHCMFKASPDKWRMGIFGQKRGSGTMSEDAKYTCGFCGSKTNGDDGFICCPYCGDPYDEEGYEPSYPLPCVRDEHGKIRKQTVKQLFQKINEELDELKDSVVYGVDSGRLLSVAKDKTFCPEYIAEEAADVKTAITTLEEALGIYMTIRCKAQRLVNQKNRKRGRL